MRQRHSETKPESRSGEVRSELHSESEGSDILKLQQTIGNQAVQRLIAAKKSQQPSTDAAVPQTSRTQRQYTSPALNIRNRISGGQPNRRIQRAVKTWAGEWDTAKYDNIVDGVDTVGVDIDLHFAPGDKVNAKQIGTTQIVKSADKGKNIAINAAVKDRNIPVGQPGEGFHVDQAPHNRNPMYAVENAPATDTKLTDKAANATWGQHGFRYKDATGAEKIQDATLKDTPQLPGRGADASQKFETTALAIEGEQQGTYYGSVQWGWETDAAGTFTKLPLTVVSNDAPSAIFGAAAQQWNTTKTSTGANALSLPTVSGKYIAFGLVPLMSAPAPAAQTGVTGVAAPTPTKVATLAMNTRVEVTDNGASNPANQGVEAREQWQKVTVIDGGSVGKVGWVQTRDLSDSQRPDAGLEPEMRPNPTGQPQTEIA